MISIRISQGRRGGRAVIVTVRARGHAGFCEVTATAVHHLWWVVPGAVWAAAGHWRQTRHVFQER
ncbi:hydrogenase expression/formation protein [Deinococcus sp. HMF7604]|uniref:hydrogenase expression/formation protein n=1 Tax=Deinococcus betulae TaxID=2873312 RepID=UPI001CCF5347|nr:hydrogenase expression/formation protein [Deinococcus betulae]MBZ9751808.1 hydrogenase expression/formation protein [Deinococcus betulae]